MPRFFVKIFFPGFLFLACQLAAQHPAWQNYTINEGLPSNDIYCLRQDSRGFLWIASNQGICCFNGYEFRYPVDTSVLAGSSAFHFSEDTHGRMWFFHLPASLWLVENDTVRPWEHNDLLRSYQDKFAYTGHYVVEDDGAVWLAIDQLGYLVVSPDGASHFKRALHKTAWSFTEVNGVVMDVSEANSADEAHENRILKTGRTAEIYRWQGEQAISLGRFPLNNVGKGVPLRVWRLRNGDFLLCCLQTFYLVHDNQLVWSGQKDVYAEEVVEDVDGALLLCSVAEGTSGLLRYPTMQHFQRDEFVNLLPGHEVMTVMRDREGGWWAGTRDAGIFYCKNPRLDIYDVSTGLPSGNVQRLASDGVNTYAGLRPFDICAIPSGGGPPRLLPWPPGADFKELTELRFDTLTGRLWCGADLCFWENKRWIFTGKSFDLSNSPLNSVSAQNITPDPRAPLWWVDYRYTIASVDRRTGLATNYADSKERIFATAADPNGNLWVATLKGLLIWRSGRFESRPFDHPALRFQARDVEILPPSVGGGLVIALRGGGLLIRDTAGQFTHLTSHDGLTANWVTHLEITAEGVIYGCSNAGLNRISRQDDGKWHIETITIKHGLPSNQVNDVVQIGQELWVATDRGVARFRSRPASAPMQPPLLEGFRVNNHDLLFFQNLRLPHDQNNLLVRFYALHFRSGGDIPYRYRLLGADTAFSYTHTREVNFAALRPGQYTFEVQAQNEDGQWSEPAKWTFEIRPAWWNTGWFRILAAAALVTSLWLWFRNRLQVARQEGELREKMRDLQTAALRAQMNPHFIFNCLSSIQHFIANNDAAAAMRYLSRFARLVRQALHGSLDGTHALADEVEMLENYLSLEQLRFRGKFNFDIKVEPGLDLHEVQIPPMLVQPFVENAILHGMKNKENDGLITVAFSVEGKDLVVAVSDNGPGFDPENKQNQTSPREGSNHKSVGMALTSNRLELLAGKDAAPPFVRESLLDDEGNRAGARVTVRIPFE